MRVSFLADVLRGQGLVVNELTGWQGRGAALQRVDAVVCHATITPRHVPDQNVAGILRDGRSDLPGPLCQLGLDRGGRWWVIADGKGNHNGYGQYGNQTVGIEAFNDGSEPWPTIQLDSWQHGVAAICKHLNLPVDRVLAHRETDPHRKSDPKGVDMDAFRKRVASILSPVTAASTQEDDLTPEEHQWLGRIHHEVAAADTSPKTVTQMLEELLRRVAAIESKIK
jgi:hypothetical protein